MLPTISHERTEEAAWFLTGSEGRVLRAGIGTGLMLLGIAAGVLPALVLVPIGATVTVLAAMNVCLLERFLHRIAQDPK